MGRKKKETQNNVPEELNCSSVIHVEEKLTSTPSQSKDEGGPHSETKRTQTLIDPDVTDVNALSPQEHLEQMFQHLKSHKPGSTEKAMKFQSHLQDYIEKQKKKDILIENIMNEKNITSDNLEILQQMTASNTALQDRLTKAELTIEGLEQIRERLLIRLEALQHQHEENQKIEDRLELMEQQFTRQILEIKRTVEAQREPLQLAETFASKVAKQPRTIVIRRRTNNITPMEIQEKMQQINIQEMDVQDCRRTQTGNLVIKCHTDMDVSKINDRIQKSDLADKVQILEPSTRIIVFSIPKSATIEDLEKIIKKKYPSSSHIKMIKSTSQNEVYHQTIELDTRTATLMLKDKRLLVNFSGCPLRRYISLQRCYRCQRLGHTAQKCDKNKFQVRCEYCADAHDSRTCSAKENTENHKCVNCTRFNRDATKEQHKSTNHPASSGSCSFYQQALKKERSQPSNSR